MEIQGRGLEAADISRKLPAFQPMQRSLGVGEEGSVTGDAPAAPGNLALSFPCERRRRVTAWSKSLEMSNSCSEAKGEGAP